MALYAIHLANLVPLNVSTHRPHPSVIQGFLDRAELPEENVAFAACVLDALTSRFATTWRDALAPGDQTSDSIDFRKLDPRQTFHVSPDVVVLAALSLAHDFLVDRMRSSRHWSIKESRGAFTVQEIEATKRAMLQDMDYGLSRICNNTLQRRLKNMQRANTVPAHTCTPSTTRPKDRRRNVSLSLQGAAIWQHGMQTPEPSP
ncbi:cyclin [Pyrenophora seminiperda CCB06]|uniref:Cyclin n=1 Tax=Pyrenophora seminiperda CCB06 TaxID=1302712 RepID=A0A3M7M6J3_9PLEO|nr:cyclin [Pyrenophora seminiperda CCB06]